MCIFAGDEREAEIYRCAGDCGAIGCRCLSGLLAGAAALHHWRADGQRHPGGYARR